jgi:hypothetical protein
LDTYIESFYEDQVERKVEGAMSLLYLCFSNENMEYMLEHETLFGTISRTLRDDYKKSLELTLYLLNIFQAYSNFTQFHEFLLTVSHHELTRRRTKSETLLSALLSMKSSAT